jgi:hypothetical protein
MSICMYLWIYDVPASSLLDPKKGLTMLKSESSWNFMSLPASNIKGDERGVLKALGLN